MELAAVAFLVMLGAGAILYAGMRQPKPKTEAPAASDGAAAAGTVDNDGADSGDGGGAGGD